MIDVADPSERFTVADYRDQAIPIIDDILSRGKQPMLVGGTGLYLDAIRYDMNLGRKGADEAIRLRLRKIAEEPDGQLRLHEMLRAVDPQTAEKLQKLLAGVVAEGTGRQAAPSEGTAAGKTGTAQTGQVQGQALASASHIRQLVHTQGIKAASPFVPQAAMELYRQAAEQGQLADPEKFSTAVLTLLRTKTPEQLSTLRGAGEGLENRLYAAAREAETVNDLYDRLKTKRYPTARLRRLVLDAVLDVPAAGLPALPPYLLVLGAKRSALPLLKHAKIPAGTSLAGLAGQDQKLQIAADMHSKAVDFSLLCRYKIQPMGHAYTAHVVLL